MKFKYQVNGCDLIEFEDYKSWPDDEFKNHLSSCDKEEAEDLAEELIQGAAQDYWENHDAHERNWPLEFTVFCDGEKLGSGSVSYELDPVFSVEATSE